MDLDDYLSDQQVTTLLRPLHPRRVERRQVAGITLSYLNQADVRAHLTRIFGFARWSADVLDAELLIDEQTEDTKRWYCAWRATLRLTICAPDGTMLATYTETAIAGNTQPQHHEALDMSLKSAESDALKRAAANLGDQFGLGLYSKGSSKAIVGITLYRPGGEPPAELPDPEPVPDAEAQLTHSVGLQGDILGEGNPYA